MGRLATFVVRSLNRNVFLALRRLALSCCFVFLLTGVSSAVIRYGRIEDIQGLRFQNMHYNWESVFIDIVNMTDRNTLFGGTMIFLDRHGNPLASARLLPKKVARNSVGRYIGYFTEGSGDMARRAVRILWDFGAR